MIEIRKNFQENIHKILILHQPIFQNEVLHWSKSSVAKNCLHIISIDRQIAGKLCELDRY